jgi:uncharacterized protein YjbI with pentapeptide repeats
MADAQSKPKTREDLEADWWNRWWEKDYSWEGLARKKIENGGGVHGEITLQDYWRRDPQYPDVVRDDEAMIKSGELTRGSDGRLWHVLHLPLRTQTGVPVKIIWSDEKRRRLSNLIHARLLVARPGNSWTEAPDHRAQLQGGVLLEGCFELPTSSVLNQVNMDLSQSFIQDFDCSNRSIGSHSSFVRSLFSGRAVLSEARFDDELNFHRTIFLQDARFDRSEFRFHAVFSETIFFEEAVFSGARFRAWGQFLGVTFKRQANFKNFNFLGNVEFHETSFCDGSDFDRARFLGAADFRWCRFVGKAQFRSVEFCGDATFQLAVFEADAEFCPVRISADKWESPVRFRGDANFRRSKFLGEADFGRAQFDQEANFWNSNFHRLSSFHGCAFKGHLVFEAAQFHDITSFRELAWPTPLHWNGAFDAANFERLCQFRGAELTAFSAFDGANFKGPLQIDTATEAVSSKHLASEMRDARHSEQPSERLRKLERGCRTLKQAMAAQSDKSREQMFYRFELMARHAQSSTPRFDMLVSSAYGFFSDYGTSILRPLLWIAYFILVFALMYWDIGWWIAAQNATIGSGVIDAFAMSGARVFAPLSLWTEAGMAGNDLGRELLFAGHNRGVALVVHFLGVVQSLISIILIFLSGLALRRRFQIN